MTPQSSETIIIAGKEFYLSDNLLPNYLASHQFQIDEEKKSSVTRRLVITMIKHPDYFMPLLCYYYPFTRKMLKKYQGCLRWDCLSENLFLDWDEDLLMEFRDKWSWQTIGENILGVTGKLADCAFLLKYYEMGLIDAEAILWNGIINAYYDEDRAFSNMDAFCEEFANIAQLISMNETLDAEMKELVMERIERQRDMEYGVIKDYSELRSNTSQKAGSLVEDIINEMKSGQEKERYISIQNQPKELEQIISFLEREGEFLDVSEWRLLGFGKNSIKPDPFMFDNPLRNGIDYTFNTPDKRKILDDAVQLFFEGLPVLTELKEAVVNLKEMETRIYSSEVENEDELPF